MLGNNIAFAGRQGSSRPAAAKRSLPINEEGANEPSVPAGAAPWAEQEAVA